MEEAGALSGSVHNPLRCVDAYAMREYIWRLDSDLSMYMHIELDPRALFCN